MKAFYTLLISFISFVSFSQMCSIDYSITTPGVHPSTLPNGQINQAFDQSLTLVFPLQDANLKNYTNFQILSVSTPLGLTWQCNEESSLCSYQPQNNAYGCISIYGNPAQEGTYPIQVKLLATNIDNATEEITFQSEVTILPTQSSNSLFASTPVILCESGQVNFTVNDPLPAYVPIANLTTGISHQWEFGNGLTSNIETPPAQTYSTVGDYKVRYERTIDTTGFKLSSVTITAVGCSDIIGYGGPDIYIEVYDGSNNMVFSNRTSFVNNASTPLTFDNLNIPLNNPPYKIKVLDDDTANLTGTGSDNCIDNSENQALATDLTLPNVNQFGQTNNNATNQQLSFSYSINKEVQIEKDSTMIYVYNNPAMPNISQDFTNHTLSTNNVNPSYIYQWNLNGNKMMDKKGTTITYNQDGEYAVMVIDEHGCYSTSNHLNINTTQTDELENAKFKIYPNPASENVQVDFPTITTGQLIITNIDGKIVDVISIKDQSSITVDIKELANDIYSIFLETDEIKSVQKLIKK